MLTSFYLKLKNAHKFLFKVNESRYIELFGVSGSI